MLPQADYGYVNGQNFVYNANTLSWEAEVQGVINLSTTNLELYTDGLETLLGTGNTTTAAINAKVPALGQALAASSTPVVLTAAQVTTLTPLSTVGVNNFPATQAVSGPLTDTQLRAVPTDGIHDVRLYAPGADAPPPPPGGLSLRSLMGVGLSLFLSLFEY